MTPGPASEPQRRGMDADDPALERQQQARMPGEIESAMMTGSDDSEVSATERFEGEMSREEALQVLDPASDE